MEQGKAPNIPAWLREQADKEAKKDVISPRSRNGELVAIACSIIVIAFIAIHQTRPTGFFEGDSGTIAAAVLYLLAVVGIVPSATRFLVGRRNGARLFEAVNMVVFLVGQLYLLMSFPFNFSHFADPLPRALEPLLDWVSGTFAKWILGIGIVGSAVFSVYTYFLYFAVKRRLSEISPEVKKDDKCL